MQSGQLLHSCKALVRSVLKGSEGPACKRTISIDTKAGSCRRQSFPWLQSLTQTTKLIFIPYFLSQSVMYACGHMWSGKHLMVQTNRPVCCCVHCQTVGQHFNIQHSILNWCDAGQGLQSLKSTTSLRESRGDMQALWAP